MEIDKEMLKGYTECILLSLLRHEDLYGYELAKRIRDVTGDTFEIKEGTMYVVLKRLESGGYVSPYWGEAERGGGRRRYYKITEGGVLYLRGKKREWDFFKSIVDVFFTGV